MREPGQAAACTQTDLSMVERPGALHRRRVLVMGAGALAVLLLATFYLVINQGMQRAHLHWAEATGNQGAAQPSEACADAGKRAAGEACRSHRLDTSQRQTKATGLTMAR